MSGYPASLGKVTLGLSDGDRAELKEPDPFVAFDRIAPDGRHVLEAGELMPWTSRASVSVYQGPLRLTVETSSGHPLVAIASAKSPAGYGRAAPNRERLGRARPRPQSHDPAKTCNDPADAPNGVVVGGGTVRYGG